MITHVGGELLCAVCFARKFPPMPQIPMSSLDEARVRQIVREEIANARKGEGEV